MPDTTPFRPATPEDLSIIAHNLREECRDECLAINGFEPLASFTADRDKIFVFDGKGRLPCAFVAVEAVGRDCVVQIAVTNSIKANTYDFVRAMAKFFTDLHRQYDKIHSLVDARNVPTAVLLRECAFEFVQRFDKFGSEQRAFNLYTSRSRAEGKAN